MSGDGLQGTQVLTSVVEDQANHEDPSISFPQIIAEGQTPTPRLPEEYVSGLDLTEVRVLTFHTQSRTFRTRVQTIRDDMIAIFVKALSCQVSFITGDANLFCNRHSKLMFVGTNLAVWWWKSWKTLLKFSTARPRIQLTRYLFNFYIDAVS